MERQNRTLTRISSVSPIRRRGREHGVHRRSRSDDNYRREPRREARRSPLRQRVSRDNHDRRPLDDEKSQRCARDLSPGVQNNNRHRYHDHYRAEPRNASYGARHDRGALRHHSQRDGHFRSTMQDSSRRDHMAVRENPRLNRDGDGGSRRRSFEKKRSFSPRRNDYHRKRVNRSLSRSPLTGRRSGRERRSWEERQQKRKAASSSRSASSSGSSSSSNSENEEELTEEQQLQRLMGISQFDTTKNKDHAASDLSGTNKKTKRKYRQYMNRRGGFNRPLSPVY